MKSDVRVAVPVECSAPSSVVVHHVPKVHPVGSVKSGLLNCSAIENKPSNSTTLMAHGYIQKALVPYIIQLSI